MRVYGVDFTSAPGPRKAITVAEAELDGSRLGVRRPPLRVRTWGAFEECLAVPGPWVAALDFPFGQPRRLVAGLGWRERWPDYVADVAEMTKEQLGELLAMYRANRPAGKKEHLRASDRRAGAKAPMKWYGVPLARMFYEGAPRLLRSGVSVLPSRPRPEEDRLALEGYPALVVRHLIGRGHSYKPSRGKATSTQEANRRAIVAALGSDRLAERYGVRVDLPAVLGRRLVADESGDLLDAVLAAVQAAWAWTRRDEGFGIPAGADADEGWIVDPATARA